MNLSKLKRTLLGDAPLLTYVGYAGCLVWILFAGDSIENLDKGEILKGLVVAIMGRLATHQPTVNDNEAG